MKEIGKGELQQINYSKVGRGEYELHVYFLL
jgi:hypothetical protein